MDVDGGQARIQAQPLDAGLLGGLAQCGRVDIGVDVLAMTAQLHPATESRMQGQQHPFAGLIENQGRRGDVAGHALAPATVRHGVHVGQHRVTQRVLAGIGRIPRCENLDRRGVDAHFRSSRSPGGAGSRGDGGSSG